MTGAFLNGNNQKPQAAAWGLIRWREAGSNCRHTDFQSVALPNLSYHAELRRIKTKSHQLVKKKIFPKLHFCIKLSGLCTDAKQEIT